MKRDSISGLKDFKFFSVTLLAVSTYHGLQEIYTTYDKEITIHRVYPMTIVVYTSTSYYSK